MDPERLARAISVVRDRVLRTDQGQAPDVRGTPLLAWPHEPPPQAFRPRARYQYASPTGGEAPEGVVVPAMPEARQVSEGPPSTGRSAVRPRSTSWTVAGPEPGIAESHESW